MGLGAQGARCQVNSGEGLSSVTDWSTLVETVGRGGVFEVVQLVGIKGELRRAGIPETAGRDIETCVVSKEGRRNGDGQRRNVLTA